MRRLVSVATTVVLVAASCGGGSESTESTASVDQAVAADATRFCEVVASFDQADNPFELPQEQARIAIPNKQALMVEAALVAPDEIRTEVQDLVESFLPIFDLFEAADFEASRINEADFDALAEAAFSGENNAAGRIMDDWVSINCDK